MSTEWGLLAEPDADPPEGGHLVAILVGGTAATAGWVRSWQDVPDLLIAIGTQLRRSGQPPSPTLACPEGFHWIGQSFATCNECGLPAWDHAGIAVLNSASPFDPRAPLMLKPWEPGQREAVRAKWDPGYRPPVADGECAPGCDYPVTHYHSRRCKVAS